MTPDERQALHLDLISRILNGSRSESDRAFAELIKDLGGVIRPLIGSFRIPGSTIEDLEQEAILSVFKALPEYRQDSSAFASYAYMVIRSHLYTMVHMQKCGKRKINNTAITLDDPDNPVAIKVSKPERKDYLLDMELCLRAIPLTEYERAVLDSYDPSESYAFTGNILRAQGWERASGKSVDNALQRIRDKARKEYALYLRTH